MNIYDLQLVKLIDEAKLQGYDFIDGQFIKSHKENVIVLNLRGNSIGDGEELGYYELFDKSYIITEEQKNKLKICNNLEEVINILEDIIEDKDYERCGLWDDLFSTQTPFWFNTNEKALSSIHQNPTYLSIGIYNELHNIHGSIQVFQCTMKQFNEHKQIYIECLDANSKNH